MGESDSDVIAAKLREIHEVIDRTFGLRDGLGVVLVLDRDLITLVGMDANDPDAVRVITPLAVKERVDFGRLILHPPPEGYELKLTGKTKPLIEEPVAASHMIRVAVEL